MQRAAHAERYLAAQVNLDRVRNDRIDSWLDKSDENAPLLKALYEHALKGDIAGAPLAELEVSRILKIFESQKSLQELAHKAYRIERVKTQQYIDQLVDGGWLMRAGVVRVVYVAPTHARAWWVIVVHLSQPVPNACVVSPWRYTSRMIFIMA